jgi:microcystin-dependent protein
MSVKINGTTGIDLVQENALPFLVGQVCFFGMTTAPAGFLKANGALVSRTTYSDLFDAIGTTYGAGDGSTTFALPDLRGEFPRGWDDGRAVDTGRTFGTAQADAFQGHGHTIDAINSTSSASGSITGRINRDGGTADNVLTNFGASDPRVLGSFNTPRISAETRPRNVALLACIKF